MLLIAQQGRLSEQITGAYISCELRAHTLVSMRALPITYIVRAANVNDKVLVNPLMKRASRLLKRYDKRISHYIADSQYY